MEKIQKDTKNYILYSPDSLNYITDNMYSILNDSIEFYKVLFDVEEIRKIQINYFDNNNDFRNYIYSLRGERESLPKYAKGTYDKGMINAFIEPNLDINSNLYNRRLHLASHELFHILYKELILEKENKERIVWFDEGMAQLFSKEFENELSDENFNEWFNYVINNTKQIPNLNNINHMNGFETKEYSGYKLSLIAVKYLFDKLGLFEFKKIMNNPEEIKKYGNSILNEAISYYDSKIIKNR